GIPAELASRSDLLDRAVLVGLPPIPGEARRAQDNVQAEFERARPELLGALLDAAAWGLAEAGTYTPDELPRMADFVLWVEACAPALGWQRGEFTELMRRAREDSDRQVVGTWAVMPALNTVLNNNRGAIEGTMAEVLSTLGKARDLREGAAPDWPRSARALSAE